MPVRPIPRTIGNSRDARGRPERETLSVPAGTGITTGTGTVYETSIVRRGDLVFTTIFMDLTGLNSSAAGDIIGVQATANSHIGRYVTADMGTLVAGYVQCLETPAGGEPDIDLYAADEATGTEDAAVTGLTNDAILLDTAADWTGILAPKSLTALPTANQYLYLVGSGGGTDATYTGGKFLLTFIGQA